MALSAVYYIDGLNTRNLSMERERELYKEIPGYEGMYEVSTFGNVRSLTRFEYWVRFDRMRPRQGRYIKSSLDQDGYPSISLSKNNKVKLGKIHILVLETFVGPRPEGYWGCHKNDIRDDNALDNLYWGLPKQNTADSRKNGGMRVGERRKDSKVTDEIARYMLTNYIPKSREFGMRAFAKKFNIAYSTVEGLIYGQTWKHIHKELNDLMGY